MAAGLSNSEIAQRLFISLNTVKTHNSGIYSKLVVVRRTQAVKKALEMGVIR
jgi:two-component system, NarL family, response regulator LiaR